MFLKIIELAENITGLFTSFANNILNFMTTEILGYPIYSLLFGGALLTYLVYKISAQVIMP